MQHPRRPPGSARRPFSFAEGADLFRGSLEKIARVDLTETRADNGSVADRGICWKLDLGPITFCPDHFVAHEEAPAMLLSSVTAT
jgi:hypothetical protein